MTNIATLYPAYVCGLSFPFGSFKVAEWISTSVSGLLQLPVHSAIILDLGLRVTSVYFYRRIYMNGFDRQAAPGDYLYDSCARGTAYYLVMLQIIF